MRKKLLLLMAMVCLKVSAEAQTRTITGKVTGSDGSPVANASVIIKGTSTGTTTNMDGTFTLSVPTSAKMLIFSAVTMSSTEVSIGEKTEVKTTLKDTFCKKSPARTGFFLIHISDILQFGTGILLSKENPSFNLSSFFASL